MTGWRVNILLRSSCEYLCWLERHLLWNNEGFDFTTSCARKTSCIPTPCSLTKCYLSGVSPEVTAQHTDIVMSIHLSIFQAFIAVYFKGYMTVMTIPDRSFVVYFIFPSSVVLFTRTMYLNNKFILIPKWGLIVFRSIIFRWDFSN